MSGMTSERLAEVLANLPDPSADLSRRERDAHALLAHVDHLTAENARLREGIEALHGAVQKFEPCPDGPWGCGEPACAEDIRDGERYHDDQPTGCVCLTCRYEDGEPHDWPCETAALLNPPTEGETSHE